MSESDDKLSGPGAGLSATGRTADQMAPGDGTGATYGDPGGTATADQELTSPDAQDAANSPETAENAEK